MVLQLEQPKQTEEAVEVVKSVEISTQQPPPIQKENKDSNEVKQLLSKKWDVEEKVIELQIEGGQEKAMKQDKEKESNSWFKKQFFKDDQSNHKKGKYIYLIVVLTVGTMIMLISNLFINNESSQNALPTFKNNASNQTEENVETFGKKESTGNSVIGDYERAYEVQLKEALDSIVGVSDVSVVVNVDATEKQVLEKNRKSQTQLTDETDREGGKRKVEDQSTDEQLVIIQNGEKEVPIVVETKKPAIRGVLVVAKGADNIQVKKWIVEAVTRSLDVPSHRVSVLPKKTKGES